MLLYLVSNSVPELSQDTRDQAEADFRHLGGRESTSSYCMSLFCQVNPAAKTVRCVGTTHARRCCVYE